jgi:predicted ATPase
MHIHSVKLDVDRYPNKGLYPFNLPIFQNPTKILFSAPMTFFVGENGSGKTTLLQALAQNCGAQIWRETERRRFRRNPYERRFGEYISIEWIPPRVPGLYFGSNYFQFFSEILDEWAVNDPGQLKYFGGESLTSLSQGQSILSYFRGIFSVQGIFFLDEPETALSPKSQLELLRHWMTLSKDGHAQFFVATHSPILLACPQATIYSFDDNRIRNVEYEQTEYYRIYRQFMNHRESFLQA